MPRTPAPGGQGHGGPWHGHAWTIPVHGLVLGQNPIDRLGLEEFHFLFFLLEWWEGACDRPGLEGPAWGVGVEERGAELKGAEEPGTVCVTSVEAGVPCAGEATPAAVWERRAAWRRALEGGAADDIELAELACAMKAAAAWIFSDSATRCSSSCSVDHVLRYDGR